MQTKYEGRIYPAVGPIIRKLRKERGINQEKFAELVGVTQEAISLIETEKRSPSLDVLFQIAGALGVRLSFIIEKAEQGV
jgi:transcriptional regulator with XRE-family HTH domain